MYKCAGFSGLLSNVRDFNIRLGNTEQNAAMACTVSFAVLEVSFKHVVYRVTLSCMTSINCVLRLKDMR